MARSPRPSYAKRSERTNDTHVMGALGEHLAHVAVAQAVDCEAQRKTGGLERLPHAPLIERRSLASREQPRERAARLEVSLALHGDVVAQDARQVSSDRDRTGLARLRRSEARLRCDALCCWLVVCSSTSA